MVINEGERCSLEKQGFVGVYYPGTYRTDRAIIASGGASCDEKLSVAMSRFLRDTGYNVLVLGFYMWEGLPDTLVSIPVDYAERVVLWLKDEKKIQSVAMTAASTGAGYTLLSASLIPEISCIMPIVPFDYVMEGTTNSFKRLGRSVYTWHGQDVPYSPWTLIDEGLPRVFLGAIKDKKYGLRRFMRYGYDHNPVSEESRIKVENMHADVLLLGVCDDDGWPSEEAVTRMVKILKEAGYPYRVEHHIYDKASHALTDGLDELSGYAKWAFKNMLPAEKKYPRECEEARQDSFRTVVNRFMRSGFVAKFMGGKDINKPEDLQRAKDRFHAMQDWADAHPQYKDKTWDFNFDDSKHKDGSYYHFTRCPLNDFARKYGFLEVLPICCDIDYITTEYSHGILHRDYTLASGGNICDYWIVPDQIKNPI